MTGPELRAARDGLGWSPHHAAAMLSLTLAELYAMETGPGRVPPAIAAYMTRCAGVVAAPPTWNHRARPVITPAGRFDSITDAANAAGITRQAGYSKCKRQASGWRYEDETRPKAPRKKSGRHRKIDVDDCQVEP